MWSGSVWKNERKSDDADGSRVATSTGRLTTEIELSEKDEKIGQGFSTSHFKIPLFGGASVGFKLPPCEELITREYFPARSKCYPSQSAKTLLEGFFELNPPIVLDRGHTTTSLSANQMIQFAREFVLEVTMASYGLFKDLVVRSGGAGAVNSHEVPGKSSFPVFVGLTPGDSVASQLHYSLPFLTGSIGLSGGEAGLVLLPLSVNEPCTSEIVNVGETIDLEDIPLALLVQREKHKKKKGQKKVADPCKLFGKIKPNPFPRCDSGSWVFTEEMLQRFPWAKLFAMGLEDPLHSRHKFFCMICCVHVSMRARGVYEIKRHYQSANHLRQDQRYREQYFPEAVRGKDARILYADRLAAEPKAYMDWEVPE